MSSLVDDSTAQIARRLRFEREARGWSLADLAARSEVSKATISKIEREKASPTAVILVRLAGAFDLTLAGLLLRAESERQRVSRTAEQQCWRDPETGHSRRQVFSQPDHPVEVVEVSLPPGQKVILPASSYARIRQAVWVLSGDLVIAEGRERHQLATGDCLGFGAPSEVTFVNEAATPCAYLVVLARN